MRISLSLLVSMVASLGWGAEPTYDVVVYGGTSGGVVAAVQAARMGKRVVLVEPSAHVGGLTAGGLGATDIGNKQAIGGLARDFYRRIRNHYATKEAWRYETVDDYRTRRQGRMVDQDTMWTFEPHVATAVYRAMLAEARVPVVLGERLDLRQGVCKVGTRITAIRMESGRTFAGRMFLDATYEGDLMAKAGVSYTVGRESNAVYGETLNGVQTAHAVHHQFTRPVDPYVRPGDPSSGLLPGVQAGGPGTDGEGSRGVQAYNFRMCTTDVPENRRPWPKPADYDPQRYELLLRNFEAGDLRIPWNPVWMPNRKTDTNNNFAISTDNIGMNYDYPDGDYATRERIVREHESYQKGLMWTLANHPRVPAEVRQEFQTLGLAKDEFTDNDNWPHQLYVREARRMKSDYVMTQAHCEGAQTVPDPVGLAAYGMDSHNVQRYVDAAGHARNEGDVQVPVAGPYPISYRSIVPRAAECENLLVPVCVSSSHIAYGSIRMEPVFMVLGQSAATAAAMAIDAGVSVQGVDYAQLRARLLADRQILVWTGPRREPRKWFTPAQLPGIVVDDVCAEFTGEWADSRTAGPLVGHGYRHDLNQDKAGKQARFTVPLPAAGRYEVRLGYTPHANRATNVPVTIAAADGRHTVRINEQKIPPIDKLFVSLGTFPFAPGQPAVVVVSCAGTDGFVVVDAVQVVKQ
jgi:hypothetical protein